MLIISDLRQVEGFRRGHRFPPPIKLTAQYNWNIVESGVKHHKPTNQADDFDCILVDGDTG